PPLHDALPIYLFRTASVAKNPNKKWNTVLKIDFLLPPLLLDPPNILNTNPRVDATNTYIPYTKVTIHNTALKPPLVITAIVHTIINLIYLPAVLFLNFNKSVRIEYTR